MEDIMEETDIVEESAIGGLSGDEPTGSRYMVRLIEGDKLGSTGYYPASVLRADGPKIFKKGTPMYLDHMLPNEKEHRPNGSVINYAGELAEDAHYENDGLYAQVEIFEHQRPLIKSLKDKIGISIRARGVSTNETINGKIVPVFQQLLLARSADFVVKAGAGGKIVSILESALEENSETDSEVEEGSLQMDEAVKAEFEGLTKAQTALDSRLTEIAESLAAVALLVKPVENEQETEESAVDPLAVAEQLANSSLTAEGRSRVLDLHRASKKPLGELIEAEEAYVNKNASSTVEGEEETEAEESAKDETPALPSAWNKGNK
jgi:hypothetical protein